MRISKKDRELSAKLAKQLKPAFDGIDEKYKKEVAILDAKILEVHEKLQRAQTLRDEKACAEYFPQLESAYNTKASLKSRLRAHGEGLRGQLSAVNERFVFEACNQILSTVQGFRTERSFEVLEKFRRPTKSQVMDDEGVFVSVKTNFKLIAEASNRLLDARKKIIGMASSEDLTTIEKFFQKSMDAVPSDFPLSNEPSEFSSSTWADIVQDFREAQGPTGSFLLTREQMDLQEKSRVDAWKDSVDSNLFRDPRTLHADED